MARLFPNIEPSEIDNSGERQVASALVGQLPAEVEVFHSFNWIADRGKGPLAQGECDFVIVDPSCGVVFVEVKGGQIEYDPRREEWVRVKGSDSQEILKKDPFVQAKNSMYEIIKRIAEKFHGDSNNLPFTYGFAVAFPDCRYKGSLPASITPDLVLDAVKCKDLGANIARIFERFRHSSHRPLSSRDVQSIHEALLPAFSMVPVIWRRVEDQEERLHRLTSDQQSILTFMSQQPCAAIQGVAGSGKTILALAKAQECARAGMRTLFLCFNRPLANWLIQAIPEDFSENLAINNYHGLVDELSRKTKNSLWDNAELKDKDFWNETAPEILMDICEKLGEDEKFDALIVDEGQDFRELWWTSLEDIFADANAKKCFYVFFDPNQAIFVKEPQIPDELGKPFMLPVNCRNTVKIAEYCASLVGQKGDVRAGAPIGEEPEKKNARSVDDAFKKAGKQIRTWCMADTGGLKYSQVAVLAPRETREMWPNDFLSVPVTEDFDEWRSNKGVLLSSWGRFKGLEADAVIILDTHSASSRVDDTDRYVACSRAKHFLVIIEVHDD